MTLKCLVQLVENPLPKTNWGVSFGRWWTMDCSKRTLPPLPAKRAYRRHKASHVLDAARTDRVVRAGYIKRVGKKKVVLAGAGSDGAEHAADILRAHADASFERD
ncbi:hypothetical protein PMIN04_004824 [Paraphaeosphaeria minitans]